MLIPILLTISLTSCASIDKIESVRKEQERSELGITQPKLDTNVNSEDITFTTIRKGSEAEDAAKAWKKMENEGDTDLVGWLISDEDYQELSRVLNLIMEYLKLQSNEINNAKEYYEGEKVSE